TVAAAATAEMAAPSIQTTAVIVDVVDWRSGSGRYKQASLSHAAAGIVDSDDERRWARRHRVMAMADGGDWACVK
ncbi:hypothetical protein ACLOJK_018956, partial [Asimina triloba]